MRAGALHVTRSPPAPATNLRDPSRCPSQRKRHAVSRLIARNGERNLIGDENRGDRELLRTGVGAQILAAGTTVCGWLKPAKCEVAHSPPPLARGTRTGPGTNRLLEPGGDTWHQNQLVSYLPSEWR